jgi:hypothetical protein
VNPNNVKSIEMYYNTATKSDMKINYLKIKIIGTSPEIQSRDQRRTIQKQKTVLLSYSFYKLGFRVENEHALQ